MGWQHLTTTPVSVHNHAGQLVSSIGADESLVVQFATVSDRLKQVNARGTGKLTKAWCPGCVPAFGCKSAMS